MRIMRSLRTGALALGLLFGTGIARGLDAQDYLYVALQGEAKIAVVDMASLEEVARLDLTEMGFTANAKPHHIAVEADGSHWYVSLIGENRVLKMDRENRIVAQTEYEVPGLMAIDDARGRLYVGRSMSAVNAPARIGEFTLDDLEVEEIDVFFPRPHALAVASGAGVAYSASLSTNQFGVVDLESFDIDLVNVDGPPHTPLQFAISPDESTLVLTTEMTGLVFVYDIEDPRSPSLRHTVEVGRQPWHPVFEPNGERVWFGLKGEDAVLAVDVATGEVTDRIESESFSHPHGSAISPDGRYLFVSGNGPGGMQMDMGMGGMSEMDDMSEMDHEAMGHEMAADSMDHEMAMDSMQAMRGEMMADSSDAEGMRGMMRRHRRMMEGGEERMGRMCPRCRRMTHESEPPTTGTLSVIDLSTGEVVKVLEMGENTTGIGARR